MHWGYYCPGWFVVHTPVPHPILFAHRPAHAHPPTPSLLPPQEIPDAREAGLAHLCEFIEDCEFTFLSVQVLHLLGQEGPTTKEPSRWVVWGGQGPGWWWQTFEEGLAGGAGRGGAVLKSRVVWDWFALQCSPSRGRDVSGRGTVDGMIAGCHRVLPP